ncbi:MAG TPA: serine hydrolase domain-containing protein [Myxococcales bacterium LLY-WYZ-16_1]|nr:serine hydrolase domain-containing protein [Myxococcales bacterium LLY-WYZ-16_1]
MKGLESLVEDFVRVHAVPWICGVAVDAERIEVFGKTGDRSPTGSRSGGFARQMERALHPWFSITKTVTATVASQLAASGELDLEGPWVGCFPELAGAGFEGSSWRDLLAHRAGVPNPVPWGWLSAADRPGPSQEALLARALPRLRRGPTARRPTYSNLGYLLAAVGLGRKTSRPFESLVQALVLDAAGLKRTRFGPDPSGRNSPGHTIYGSPFDLLTQLAGAWRVDGGRSGRWRRLGPIRMDGLGAGGLWGPPEELGRYLQAFIRSEPGFEVGSRSGSGWVAEGALLHHGGSGLGHVCHCGFVRARSVGAAVFAGRSGTWGPDWLEVERLFRQVLAAADP